jgi:hypothetical protein
MGPNLVLNRTDPIRQRLPELKHQHQMVDRPLRLAPHATTHTRTGHRDLFASSALDELRDTRQFRQTPPTSPHGPSRAAPGKVRERVHYVIDSPV